MFRWSLFISSSTANKPYKILHTSLSEKNYIGRKDTAVRKRECWVVIYLKLKKLKIKKFNKKCLLTRADTFSQTAEFIKGSLTLSLLQRMLYSIFYFLQQLKHHMWFGVSHKLNNNLKQLITNGSGLSPLLLMGFTN